MRNRVIRVSAVAAACMAAGVVYLAHGQLRGSREEGATQAPLASVDPAPPLGPEEWALVVRAHEAGVQGNADALEDLVGLLQHELRDVRLAALWSLARLGRAESLPAFRALAQDSEDRLRVAACARAAAARVEATAGGMPATRAALGQRMAAVVQGTGLSAAVIRNSVMHPEQADRRTLALAEEILVQLADMAVVAADRGVSHPAGVSPVDLSLHPMAKLKAELSAYPKEERIRRLVEELARATSGQGDTQRRVQLLIDEGPEVVPAVIAQLKVQPWKDAQNTHVPFAQFFRVLAGLGGREAEETVAAFRTHPVIWVRHYANSAYRGLARGWKRYRVTDYTNAYTDHHQGR